MNLNRTACSRRAALVAGLAALPLLFCTAATTHGQVSTDNFDTFHDYSGGDVTGTIWDGTYNASAGGGIFAADLFGADQLHIDSAGTNTGWEGGRSTAPFLYKTVPAGQDFTATVEIAAQTSGFWSASGIIARAADSPTPPGTDADNDDENFVGLYSFRTDSENPDSGNTLNKRIENGGQLNDWNIDINPGTIPNPTPPPDELPNPEPLPLQLQLERIGGGTSYRSSVSTDGGTTWKFQSRVFPTAGNSLMDSAVDMQVGPVFQMFGTDIGESKMNFFEIDVHDPLASPGAPDISTNGTDFLVEQGSSLAGPTISDSSGQGLLAWFVEIASGPDGGGAGPSVNPGQLPTTPDASSSSELGWNTGTRALGDYVLTVTAMNDWGESDSVDINVRIFPEPTAAGLLLIAFGALGACGRFSRRRDT